MEEPAHEEKIERIPEILEELEYIEEAEAEADTPVMSELSFFVNLPKPDPYLRPRKTSYQKHIQDSILTFVRRRKRPRRHTELSILGDSVLCKFIGDLGEDRFISII